MRGQRIILVIVFLLFLFSGFSNVPQSLKIEIEGQGQVEVSTNDGLWDTLFLVSGTHFFSVEKDSLVLFITTGNQSYLRDIEICYNSGQCKSQKLETYASLNTEYTHMYKTCIDSTVKGFHIVFKEIQPWDGKSIFAPYFTNEPLVCSFVVVSPEELVFIFLNPLKGKNEQEKYENRIILQKDLDLGGNIWSSLSENLFDNWGVFPYYHNNRIILGNNHVVKNYTKGIDGWNEWKTLFSYVKEIHNVHVLKGYGPPLYHNIRTWATKAELVSGCTSDVNMDGGYFLGFWNAIMINCINFGDSKYFENSIIQDRERSASFFNIYTDGEIKQKNLVNWGSNLWNSKDQNIGFTFLCKERGQVISNVFNFGRVLKLISIPDSVNYLVCSPYFNDKNLAPEAEMPTHGAVGYNLESRQLIDAAFMRSLMGDSAEEDFIFEDGFYPRLRHMDERPGRLAASPILLYPDENADDVKKTFYVDTNYGVRWVSLSPELVEIVGDSGYVRMPVAKDSVVRIEAWKEDFSKHVYLTIRARSFVDKEIGYDTVCPGDSVWMVTSYARNEGWNYDVVWGEGNDVSPDTVYRLHLHHYPIYHEVVHQTAVERDSLPYIYGEDTIRNFGLTELHRHQTVHGCDSVIYLRLDTLYIHREKHFYDTLQSCGDAKLYKPGGLMIVHVTSDYTDKVLDPYKGGTDSIYHLHVEINPVYHTAHTDSCYIEDLPHMVGDRLMQDFGTQADSLVTVNGCDSVCEYVLSRRWHYYRVRVEVRGEGTANVTDTVLREDGSLWLAFTASPCNMLDSLKIDGHAASPRNRYELKDLHGDCTVEAVFTESAPAESVLRYEVCGDSLPVIYNGEAYGAGEHEIRIRNAQGCDSVIRLYVQGKENAARLVVTDTIAPICGGGEISFSYRPETGAPKHLRLAFDPLALSAGFRDTVLAVSSTGTQRVRLPLPPFARPDRYVLHLLQADGTGCYVAEETLSFEIPYPSNIIVQKWNDVLAVLAAEYNGGYDFTGYQWYRNGEPIEGETRPYYYAKPYLRSSDIYAVLLERASDGQKLMSCGVKRKGYPKEISLELRPNPTAQGGEVQVSVDGRPEAEGVIEVFDGTGKPIYERAFRAVHTLRATWQPGTYVVRVRDGKGLWTATGKLTVL